MLSFILTGFSFDEEEKQKKEIKKIK